MWDRLKLFLNPIDGRYEDMRAGRWPLVVLRDFSAGLIVAMMAIPLAMGFAMASGLKPEQGIVGGAVAGLVGALFGGSKYQVYGPTAAFIPVILGLMAAYATPEDVKALAPDVMRHRLILTYEAEAQDVSADEVVAQVLAKVPVP